MASRCGLRRGTGHDSKTETFVALRAEIDNWRWKGVPLYIRTGKRLARAAAKSSSSSEHSILDFAAGGAKTLPNN